MRMPLLRSLVAAWLLSAATASASQPFTGEWEIDIRTPAEKKAGALCGGAYFRLRQTGNKVTGDHSMATVGCGRLNEGGKGTVVGTVRGKAAVLRVTSGRNGEVVQGVATRKGDKLHWEVRERVKPGKPDGESGLILNRGLLRKVKR